MVLCVHACGRKRITILFLTSWFCVFVHVAANVLRSISRAMMGLKAASTHGWWQDIFSAYMHFSRQQMPSQQMQGLDRGSGGGLAGTG